MFICIIGFYYQEEQIMYPSSLEHEHERFTVVIVNCKRQGYGVADSPTQENDALIWEITRALKCE